MREMTTTRSIRCVPLHRLLACAACLSLSACFASHGGPKDSTETGNPPVIDRNAVALHVTTMEVHITGASGAVTPGGAAVEITSLTTGKVTQAKAAADGSFDARVDGSPDDAFVVRAASGGAKSAPVYVVRGMAAVGDGKDGSLSCDQRDQLAGAQLELAAMGADTSCMVDAECEAVIESASCHDRCQYAVVSAAGSSQIDATAAAIDAGLCASYAADGCKNVVLPCPSPPAVTCSAGQCVRASTEPLSCEQRDQMAGDEIAMAVRAAETACSVNADCVIAAASVTCHDNCGAEVAVTKVGKAVIDTAVSSIENGVCSSFAADGCHPLVLPCMAPLPGPSTATCSNGQCMLSGNTCQFATNPGQSILLDCTEKVVVDDAGDGFRPMAPAGSECQGEASFSLTLATRDLEWSVCTINGNAPWKTDSGARVLTQNEYDSVRQALVGVTVWDGSNQCGADKETIAIDIVTANGTQHYADSFYSCHANGIYVDAIDGAVAALRVVAHP